jgi:hypothetical protein
LRSNLKGEQEEKKLSRPFSSRNNQIKEKIYTHAIVDPYKFLQEHMNERKINNVAMDGQLLQINQTINRYSKTRKTVGKLGSKLGYDANS